MKTESTAIKFQEWLYLLWIMSTVANALMGKKDGIAAKRFQIIKTEYIYRIE